MATESKRGFVARAAAGFLAASAGLAYAQVYPGVAQGSNHDRAFSLFNLTGSGIGVGVVETGSTQFVQGGVTYSQAGMGIISSGTDNLGGAVGTVGTRLLGQWNFNGISLPPPANPPTISPTAANGSWHSTLVSSIIASHNPNFRGVARGANIYFAGIGNTGDQAAVEWLRANHGVRIFNFSWGAGLDNYGVGSIGAYYDREIAARDYVIVKAAGNRGTGFDPIAGGMAAGSGGDNRITAPGDFYNGITVGATDEAMQARAYFSSYWASGENGSAPDVRQKPDILAPGSRIGNDGIAYPNGGDPGLPAGAASGTSFAAPQVTGTVALLAEDGLTLGNQNGLSYHLLAKSVILNSARKRHITGENSANATALDNQSSGAQASDDDYLNGGVLRVGAQANNPNNPTRSWTPSQWSYGFDNALQRNVFRTNAPLDDEQGVGLLDSARSIVQFRGGEGFPVGQNQPIGWALREVVGMAPTHDYTIGTAIPAGSFITATLTWDRQVDAPSGTITPLPIALFDLYILFRGNWIAVSNTRHDTVQHLHIPVPFDGNPGDYAISVGYFGGGSFATQYSLSWWTVPTPSSMMLLIFGGVGVLRRSRSKPPM